eukprot:1340996-Rhodomonas_salina.2
MAMVSRFLYPDLNKCIAISGAGTNSGLVLVQIATAPVPPVRRALTNNSVKGKFYHKLNSVIAY